MEPLQVTEDVLFAQIGRLTIEVQLLRAELAAEKDRNEKLVLANQLVGATRRNGATEAAEVSPEG